MTTVTSLTADRMLAIEAASVVDGDVIGGNLILTKHDGSQINAGPVTGPQGPQGPVGSDLAVLSAIPVLDVGLANQIRAGRQLGPADFGNIGLSAPLGLWNLSDLSDVSGNGRNLLNKGAVGFAAGINGGANTAAQFTGNSNQALYISDSGASDPFRLKTGSLGCWFKATARNGIQMLMSKTINGSFETYLHMYIQSVNTILFNYSLGSSLVGPSGVTDVADDRWHFVVVTLDGHMIKLYVDSVLDGMAPALGISAPTGAVAPFNIGARGADSSVNGTYPLYGRIDEAFVTADVLSEDQVRNLYCAKIPHTLAAVPSRLSLNVRRRKKGSAFAVADFSTQPLRLYNFSGGSLGDEGSNGVVLTNNGAAVSVAGVDGAVGNAFNFAGAQSLSATDAGLPSGLVTRSYGLWFKTTKTGLDQGILNYGVISSGDIRLWLSAANTLLCLSAGDSIQGPLVVDGIWHHVVCVEDNAPIDQVKRKAYIDGRLFGNSLTLNSIVLAGANRFRIGSAGDGSSPFTGQIDGVFVCDYALTAAQVAALYAKGSQALTPSPKNVGDHIEAMDAASLLATFDTLESQHQIDLKVAA